MIKLEMNFRTFSAEN